MYTTTKFSTSTLGIPQHGTNWCIPASIENLLRSEKIFDLTQEDLVYEFLIQTAYAQKLNNGQSIDLRNLQRFEVLEYFRCLPLPNVSFKSLSLIVNSILTKKGNYLQLSFISNIQLSKDYIQKVETILQKDKPVLISAGHSAGWHITIVYQCDGTNLWSYDPGRDKHIVEPISNYKFSHDILFVS